MFVLLTNWRAALLVLACAAAGVARAQQDAARLRVEAGRQRIYAGESFILYARVEGADAGIETPVFDPGVDAEISFLGSQSESRTQYYNINGRQSVEHYQGRVFHFNVRPRGAGVFHLGRVRARVGGKWLEAAAPSVEVAGVDGQEFVKVSLLGGGQTLVDEPFTVTLEIRVRGLEGGYADNEPLFPQTPPTLEAEYLNFIPPNGLEGPNADAALGGILAPGNAAGFAINHHRRQGLGGLFGFDDFFGGGGPLRFRPQHRVETVDNVLWHVYTLATTHTGREEGEYQFGPVTFKGPVIAGVEADSRGVARGVPRDIFAVGPALVARVTPPPEEGRPAAFFGGVGKSMRLRAELDTSVCKTGDPLSLTLDVTGNVSLRNLRPPRISNQPGIPGVFRVYDESARSSAIEGGRRFTYTLRPLAHGTIEFPPLELAFYNIETRRYETASTPPIPLEVRATTQIWFESAPGGTGEGLRADGGGAFPSGITLSRHARKPAWERAGFWWMLASPLYFLLFVASARALPRVRAGWRVFRAWQAGRGSAGALRTATDAAQLERAFRRFLTARMKLAGESITPPEVEEALGGGDAGDRGDTGDTLPMGPLRPLRPLSLETRVCLEALAEAVYRPGGGAEFAALREQTLACAARLEHARRGGRRGRSTGSAVPLVFFALFATTLRADPAANEFTWQRANGRMASASAHAEFLEAAEMYGRLPPDGGVMANLGAALLMAGEPAAAYEAFARAERRLGHHPGLEHDVALALRLKNNAAAYETPWTRVLFAWHYAMPMDTRLMLGAAGWAALWIALLVWRFAGRLWQGWRRATTEVLMAVATVAGVALLLVFGASGLVSVAQEWMGRNHHPMEWVAPAMEDAP